MRGGPDLGESSCSDDMEQIGILIMDEVKVPSYLL